MPRSTLAVLASWCLLAGCWLVLPLATADPPDNPKKAKIADKIKEIAGSAEFLRSVPKHFATLKGVDAARNQVTLLIEGEVLAKAWPLVPDAELKVLGWWGRLADFTIGDRVWVWFKNDRQKQPVAVAMLADEMTEQDIHGGGVTVDSLGEATVTLRPAKGDKRTLKLQGTARPIQGATVYVQSSADKARVLFDAKAFAAAREKQQALLRQRWTKEGLPGTVAFVHVFSGEMDLLLDHESMRWARSLQVGDSVTLPANPPIKGLVKAVTPWRERTQLRLVVHSLDLADLAAGQRLHLVRTPPPPELDTVQMPPDIDRPRTRQERIDWFLASVYCTCGVAGDRCTGHFYSLASCNPNACGMPNFVRGYLAKKIDQGLSDRQIFEQLLKDQGPGLLQPHLLP